MELRLWTRVIIVFAAVLLICTAFTYLGQFNQLFEILSHLVSLILVFTLLVLICALATKSKTAVVLASVALAVNFFRMAPAFHGEKGTDGHPISILSFNCERDLNSDPQIFRRIVDERKAEILCFCEVDKSWKQRFEQNYSDFPYQQICAVNGGVACLSKIPITFSQVRFSQYNNHPRLLCVFKLADGEALTGLIVHPGIPLNERSFKSRNSDFEVFVSDLSAITGSKFITGDMNCGPWSHYYQKLLDETGMRDAMNGFGVVSTWSPKWMHLPLIPIDHCLVSPGLTVTDYAAERDAGSDHRPLFVKLSINKG